MKTPYIIVIAGPNGVGKSSFARWYLAQHPTCERIVDPDAIARELEDVEASVRNTVAGRLALATIDDLIRQGRSFAIETTLSGRSLVQTLRKAEMNGYTIAVCLLKIPSVEISINRVMLRVRSGGHDIPMDDQLRRFERSYRNFHELYVEVCHVWTIYDAQYQPPEIAETGFGGFSQK